MGYAQLGDDNENYIGVVGHIDVVPEGTDWDYPPFDLTLDNDVFYGRGVLDNKGPIIANLYALYLLKEMNYPFPKLFVLFLVLMKKVVLLIFLFT